MELCTAQAISNPLCQKDPILSTIHFKSSLVLRQSVISIPTHRLICFSSTLLRAVPEGETFGTNQYVEEESIGVVTIEDVTPVKEDVNKENVENIEPEVINLGDTSVNGETQTFEFLDNLNLDLDDSYSIVLYGIGGLAALYLASAVVGAIDSIPLFPKLMEVVGLSYSLWFGYRYLIFKENRDELAAKIEGLKQQVTGSSKE